jgi:peptidoglycan/xylan/chitin deacetylase (PgdA/CDA1 family)
LGTLLIRLAIIGLLCGLGFNLSRLLSRGLSRFAGPRACRWISGMLAVLFSVGLILSASWFYVYYGFGYQGDIFRKAKTDRKIVALTFDDGPSPLYTPRILDILAEKQVPAAFFMVGAHVDKYPDIAARIAAEGHELGSHTYDHVNVPTLPTARLSAQLLKTNIAILNATGDYPLYIRPPRGLYDGRFRRLSELLGHQIVLWSLSAQDWMELMTVDRIVKRILTRVRPGDIILFHDSGALLRKEGASRESTVAALPLIIEGLWERGYQIVPLAELLTLAHPEEEPIPYMPE